MRGLEKNCTRWSKPTHTHTHTDGHGDSMTKSAQWGQFSENQFLNNIGYPKYVESTNFVVNSSTMIL